MATHDIITIGASAGGVEPLQRLVSLLPAKLPAALFIVLHIPQDSPSLLPDLLQRAGSLPALAPFDNTPIENGRIYIAPPGRHMLLEAGRVRIIYGPKENRHRPAIDPLFRSAALAYCSRVVGVVLSGNLDDGTAGLLAIKAYGGTTVVQDPAEASFPGMPENALKNVSIDHQLSIDEIAELVIDLANRPVSDAPDHPPPSVQTEVEFSKMERDIDNMSELGGAPTAFACPSCHGALWEFQNGKLTRYRCHTGHAFSPESLLAEQSDAIEQALYSALRALREKATALRRLAGNYARLPRLQRDYELRASDVEKSADSIRSLLNGAKRPATDST
jgi:two-component system, chemotaxis family, protein-glutamate methylesterase/glutaminase